MADTNDMVSLFGLAAGIVLDQSTIIERKVMPATKIMGQGVADAIALVGGVTTIAAPVLNINEINVSKMLSNNLDSTGDFAGGAIVGYSLSHLIKKYVTPNTSTLSAGVPSYRGNINMNMAPLKPMIMQSNGFSVQPTI